MPLAKKKLEQVPYSQDNAELQAELEAIKSATGARRIELSRNLVRRFCDLQRDLQGGGDFWGQLGVSGTLTEFIFTGLGSWANGGSLESAVSVDAKPGRPPQTHRNQALFEDVRQRVSAGWDVHAACYATADALQLGDVQGLEALSLSPSSIRRIYYSVMSSAEEKENSEDLNLTKEEVAQQSSLDPLDGQTVNRAKSGQWKATTDILDQLHRVCDLVISNRYLMMIACVTGLNLDVLKYQSACLKKIVDGQSPNEAYGYEPEE
ncbi:MAG: hypothetical protein HOK97_12950 [Deltaproteobacteria bacterium]|nr:hypothetical protein [Deltaproteobacteria bacterium]MBT6490670.1 hypothetical protein [Deltaproteobacteria bacterium]